MATNAINGLNYDATCTRIRWNLSALGGFTKFTIPEQKKKVEKIALIGDQYATVRTPGVMEISDATASITAVGWKEMLAKLPDEYSNIEFPITTNERHVQIAGSYGTILDRCQIIGVKGGDIEGGSEKNRIVELTIQVITIRERGADGRWKLAARRPGANPDASPAARALMF